MIISPNLAICTILISAMAVHLSLMFLSATHSPSVISHVSVFTGATAAGEAFNDKQHENNVVAARGQFYPLIVETFGVWTPFARDNLKDIARRTTARNRLSPRRYLEI